MVSSTSKKSNNFIKERVDAQISNGADVCWKCLFHFFEGRHRFYSQRWNREKILRMEQRYLDTRFDLIKFSKNIFRNFRWTYLGNSAEISQATWVWTTAFKIWLKRIYFSSQICQMGRITGWDQILRCAEKISFFLSKLLSFQVDPKLGRRTSWRWKTSRWVRTLDAWCLSQVSCDYYLNWVGANRDRPIRDSIL